MTFSVSERSPSSCLTCSCNCLSLADSTGTHSLYTTYKDYELMFHVSTMLPHMPKNRQQVRAPSPLTPPAQPRGRFTPWNLQRIIRFFLKGIQNR